MVARAAVVSYALGYSRIAVEDRPLDPVGESAGDPPRPPKPLGEKIQSPPVIFSVKIRPPHEVIPARDGSDFFCSLIVMHYDDATALSCTAKGLEPRLPE